MSLLLINTGNTHCTVVRRMAETAGGDFQPLLVAPTPVTDEGMAELAGRIAGLRLPSEPAAAASVVPPWSRVLGDRLAGLQLVDHTWDLPFATDVSARETVGADRWCNVAAAVGAGLADALIVDAGTATTIDVLAGCVFVGGLIAPGMAFAARKLQESAPMLWPEPFEACPLRPGRDTSEALRIGAFHVGVRGVTGTIEALLEQMPRARVVLTGGLGKYLRRVGWSYDPHWTLRGLALLASRRADD